MQEIAYAKINLALHVRRRGPDGYHHIETLFAFAEEGDRLAVSEGAELTLEGEGEFAASLPSAEANIVLAAARELRQRYAVSRGAALRLDKRLPVAAGIGGGSADAAAALRLLQRWWDLPSEPEALLEIARSLGADVAACIVSAPLRGEGRGDDLAAVDGTPLAGAPLLLVNPRVPVSTAAVFGGWDGVDRGPLAAGDVLAASQAGRNDLEPAALAIAPQIGDVLAALSAAENVRLARMSGSGATCFALFEREADRDAASAAIAARHPRWWRCATRLRATPQSRSPQSRSL
jgi:4-diphosphocytidyl-2-C-methyl-D-erythritol kinase